MRDRTKKLDVKDFPNLRKLKFKGVRNGNAVWECKCRCGEVFTRAHGMHPQTACRKCSYRRAAEKRTEHGMTKTPTHRSWKNSVSAGAQWLFDEFLAAMGERPEGATLRRLDATQPHSPENCCWVGGAAGWKEFRNRKSNMPPNASECPQNRRKRKKGPGTLPEEKVRYIRSCELMGHSIKRAAARLGISKEWFRRIQILKERQDVPFDP